ncbi:MAG: hypothetical protein CMM18_05180, partial [Rhodospirillaceae bacterium]|nr:hypothetical protein [Rhodospirillaceae bacterium]
MKTNKSISNQQKIISVIVPYKIEEPFQYYSLEDNELSLGDFVSVPLGRKIVNGVVWDLQPKKILKNYKLKSVIEKLDIPPLSSDLISLVRWVSDYTLSPLGSVIKLAMPPLSFSRKNIKVKKKLFFNGVFPKRLTSGRSKVLEFLSNTPGYSLDDLAKLTGVSKNIIKNLVNQGYIKEKIITEEIPFIASDIKEKKSLLTSDQLQVSSEMISKINNNLFSVTLLDGVTGSGKTEVYFEAIYKVISTGGQVLIMLPEISLTEQWL